MLGVSHSACLTQFRDFARLSRRCASAFCDRIVLFAVRRLRCLHVVSLPEPLPCGLGLTFRLSHEI